MNRLSTSNTPKKISNVTDDNVKMNCGLWLILKRAIKDSSTPTTTAKRNWIPKNSGIEKYKGIAPIKKLAINAPYIANFR